MSKDLWIAEYEAVADDYGINAERHGEEYARQEARRELRRLGFDEGEISDHLAEIAECCA